MLPADIKSLLDKLHADPGLSFSDVSNRIAPSPYRTDVGSVVLHYAILERNVAMSLRFKQIVMWAAVLAVFLPSCSNVVEPVDSYAEGMVAFHNGDLTAAIRHFTTALEKDHKNADALLVRGTAFRKLGEFDKAIADYTEVLRLHPKDAVAYKVRGTCGAKKHDFAKAIDDYDKAIRLDPKDSDTYAARGLAWHAKGNVEKAIADYGEAIRLDPKKASAYAARAACYRDNGGLAKAIDDLDEAIRLDPEWSESYNGRARIRATCTNEKYRDGAKAIKDATYACELTNWNEPEFLDTLAAAYAEAGQFDKAVEWQDKAIELAPSDKQTDFGTRLKLYHERKPYRKPYRDEPKK